MDLFRKRKRKSRSEEQEEGEIIENEEPPKKQNKIISMVKGAFAAIKGFGKKTQGPDITRSGISLFNTPEALKSTRYSMTPHAIVSPTSGSSDASYFETGTFLKMTEDRTTEFKAGGGRYSIDVLPEHIRKYGSGFLNSNGGSLLIGVCDDGLIQGTYVLGSRDKAVIEGRINREFARFAPKVTPSMYSVTFVPVSRRQTDFEWRRGYREYCRDLYVMRIKIRIGEVGEIYEDGLHNVFIRREGSVEGPLNPLQIKDLVLTKYREKIKEREKKRKRKEEDEVGKRPAKNSKISPIPIDLTADSE